MTDSIDVLIAEDHPIFRRGLMDIINSDPYMSVVANLSNGINVTTVAKNCSPDIIVLDIDMPVKSGLEVATDLQTEKNPAKVIFLTSNSSYEVFSKAIAAGAKGYILKDNAIEDTVNCIRLVAQGKMYVSPSLTGYLINDYKAPKSDSLDSLRDKLTPSEFKILNLIAEHKTSKVISEELFISPKTVENHRTNISKKLGVSGTNGLLKFVLINSHLFDKN